MCILIFTLFIITVNVKYRYKYLEHLQILLSSFLKLRNLRKFHVTNIQ